MLSYTDRTLSISKDSTPCDPASLFRIYILGQSDQDVFDFEENLTEYDAKDL